MKKIEVLKISFDFDGTLSEIPMQNLCKKYIEIGAEVYVTTSRSTGMEKGINFENKDLFEVTDKLGISRKNIIFTNYADKYTFVKDFDLHFDDDELEIDLINDYPGFCIGMLYCHNYTLENQIAKF